MSTSLNHILTGRRAETVRPFRDERPYALSLAGEINGVTFINDSASVSLEQTASNLADVERPVVWIVEANGNQGDLSLLGDLVKNRVKAIVAVGSEAYEVHDALWKYLKFFTVANSWNEAIDLSLIMAAEGDTVLFSPGCRCVEPFGNYRERGAYFDQLVKLRQS
ncbi:MAG TPA: hypothetical protein VKY29_02550 [Cryomorphaceae bacterium]|nr:hypothetical protein [Cryomorphaceae bacterium]